MVFMVEIAMHHPDKSPRVTAEAAFPGTVWQSVTPAGIACVCRVQRNEGGPVHYVASFKPETGRLRLVNSGSRGAAMIRYLAAEWMPPTAGQAEDCDWGETGSDTEGGPCAWHVLARCLALVIVADTDGRYRQTQQLVEQAEALCSHADVERAKGASVRLAECWSGEASGY